MFLQPQKSSQSTSKRSNSKAPAAKANPQSADSSVNQAASSSQRLFQAQVSHPLAAAHCNPVSAGKRVKILKGPHQGMLGRLTGCTHEGLYFVRCEGMAEEAVHAIANEGPFLPDELELLET